jgi:hypothetical protein
MVTEAKEGYDETVVNQSRQTRAESRRLARNHIDSIVVVVLNDAVVNRSRHTRAKSRRFSSGNDVLDSILVVARDEGIFD